MLQQFGDDVNEIEFDPKTTIAQCFNAVDKKEVDYAIVPFENSTNGQVVFTYDLLRDWFIPKDGTASQSTFKIVGEQFVAINHYFLTRAKSVADIKTIYSHPQVWGQVQLFLARDDIKSIKRVDTNSTSEAAKLVGEDKTNTSACICSKMSADVFNLPSLYQSIEDNSNNTTRFLILGYERPLVERTINKYVTSVMFTLRLDDAGALCAALDSFRRYGINLTSINSRPSQKKQWQYVFFVELFGDGEEENVKLSLESLRDNCLDLVILGSFERSWRYEEHKE